MPGETGLIDEYVIEGAVVSMIKALLAPKLPVAPGAGRVKIALLPSESLMVPPLNTKELAAT
jgi:hypothetical protein